jgi:hypothetical protein
MPAGLQVSSGSRLPQDAAGACDADGRRQALVAQLEAEESAARAALEALKQVWVWVGGV